MDAILPAGYWIAQALLIAALVRHCLRTNKNNMLEEPAFLGLTLAVLLAIIAAK